MIHLSYSAPFDVVSQEFYLYSFGGILVAIGGAAGLFIGLSLFQAGSWLLYFRVRNEEENRAEDAGSAAYGSRGLE